VTKTGLSLGTLNYMEINITKNGSANSVAFNNVTLGSDVLGSWSLSGNPGGSLVRSVTAINLTSGFTLTGTIALTGSQPGGDGNYVEIDIGSVPPSDSTGPVTSDVHVTPVPVIINGSATVSANVDDTTTGGSNIKSAEYQLNSGTYSSMTATDLAFDSVSEDVQATFTATQLGQNQVCVRGTDVLDNVGDPTCQYFLVTYNFDGFYSPIDNGIETGVVNIAKAGQAIPAKWRLTDANGVGISDPASFVALWSYLINCDTLSGIIADSVEEYAAGNSGLQYNGDGYWQFNWKTPKTYAGQCRAMYVEFNSGALSPVVAFKFNK
jgi:hypothetical protein